MKKTANQYRERANFLRMLADDPNLADLRDSYLSLARDWDHMADMAVKKDVAEQD